MHPSDFNPSKQGSITSSYLDCNDSVDGSALGVWYEDLEEYEDNLQRMATANLDQSFQDELQHVNQWFGFLSDAEKTATIYALLQHSSQVQIKFFIRMLQEMRKSNPLNRASERASTLMNLSNRRLSSINQQQNRNTSSRHSFALGDTQELNRIFNSNKKWLDSEEPHHPSPPQPRTTISVPRASNQLRPRSVIELNHAPSSFSNSWSRQPNVFNSAGVTENYRPIERPRSADITSWQLPSSTNKSATWQALSGSHDVNAQSHWKNNNNWVHVQQPQHTTSSGLFPYFDKPKSTLPSSSTTSTSAAVRFDNEYNQFLGPLRHTLDHKKNHGYGSDPGNSSSTKYGSRLPSVQNTSNHHQSLSHPKTRSTHPEPSTKEEAVDMELLEDVTAWFRSMRLHKYNTIFEKMRWQDIVKLNDQDLQDIGVAALGARRKMLKVFENIQEHCKSHHVDF